jgi:hypothetical protein
MGLENPLPAPLRPRLHHLRTKAAYGTPWAWTILKEKTRASFGWQKILPALRCGLQLTIFGAWKDHVPI